MWISSIFNWFLVAQLCYFAIDDFHKLFIEEVKVSKPLL